ncbi:unnamed protein product [Linum tenue]|uniref:Transmembrane protein n=1 Tax=Linum tenue TaxID=586396 RepID=A0AAV0KAC5_9ROSI|nr:unnamed protein product [Linum tenue]CAI0419148.1 unnamed protein product [Linum tenue]
MPLRVNEQAKCRVESGKRRRKFSKLNPAERSYGSSIESRSKRKKKQHQLKTASTFPTSQLSDSTICMFKRMVSIWDRRTRTTRTRSILTHPILKVDLQTFPEMFMAAFFIVLLIKSLVKCIKPN